MSANDFPSDLDTGLAKLDKNVTFQTNDDVATSGQGSRTVPPLLSTAAPPLTVRYVAGRMLLKVPDAGAFTSSAAAATALARTIAGMLKGVGSLRLPCTSPKLMRR